MLKNIIKVGDKSIVELFILGYSLGIKTYIEVRKDKEHEDIATNK